MILSIIIPGGVHFNKPFLLHSCIINLYSGFQVCCYDLFWTNDCRSIWLAKAFSLIYNVAQNIWEIFQISLHPQGNATTDSEKIFETSFSFHVK